MKRKYQKEGQALADAFEDVLNRRRTLEDMPYFVQRGIAEACATEALGRILDYYAGDKFKVAQVTNKKLQED